METFRYTVKLEVEVTAFDGDDAWNAVDDAFGVGDNMGVNVTSCEFEETRGKKRR